MRRLAKRIIDVVAALLLLVLTAPVCCVVGLLVRLRDGRPVLHREQRLGQGGRPFTIYKFRSMTTSAGPGVAADGDPRVTALGRRLRRYRLDELPQLLNVLRGDMSLVGPRPMLPDHVAAIPPADAATLLSLRPGVTGVSALAFIGDDAALSGAGDAEAVYLQRVLPHKVAAELHYVRTWSLTGDLRLLVETIMTLCSPRARRRSAERVRTFIDRPASQARED